MRTILALAFLLTAGAAHGADKLRLERLDASCWPSPQLYLSFVDGDGRVITGRQKEDFKIILDSAEQGAARTLKTFDATGEPINIVAVVQVSGAMQEVIEELKKGVKSIADALDPKSKPKMALIGYASDTKRLADLGSPADVEAAANTMAIDAEGVEVHMLDAVRTAIDILGAAPKTERKLIVLFSDGIDVAGDRKTFNAIGKKALENGIVIDTIGFAPFEQSKLRNLQELSKASNGYDRLCKSASDVTAQFLNVVDEIKKQYKALFELALKADGKVHLVQAIVEKGGMAAAYSNTFEIKIPDKDCHPVVATAPGQKSRWWLWVLLGVGGLGLILLIAWLVFREKNEDFDDEPVPAPQPVKAAPQPQPQPQQAGRTVVLDPSTGGRAPVMGWIVGMSGKHTNQTFKFKPGRTVIGTAQDCDIVIEDQFMSSRHCEVVIASGGFKLVDLGSTNGIVVNGKKVPEHELVDNDVFRLGRTEFKFKSIG